MEKKTKHRIAGILVVLGLLVILIPLFQSNNDLPTNTAEIKAPPFPDQPVQVMSAEPDEAINLQEQINPPTPSTGSVTPHDTVPPVSSVETQTVQPPVEIIHNDTQAEKAPTKKPEINSSANKKPLASTVKTTKKLAHHVKSSKQTTLKTVALLKPADNNGLLKLKQAVWVIQIGSFKNKTNALRLVNRLRAHGYRAFIQQVSTTFGQSTRVFVGPETKRTSAHQLAGRLETELHVRGVVISYKPLML